MLEVRIENKTGLHARPAGLIVKEAQGFASDIALIKGEKRANAKSIMAVLGLGVVHEDVVIIEAVGADAEAAEKAIAAVIEASTHE